MLNTLDDRNIELTKTLFDLKHNLDIYKLLGLNANKVNSVGVGSQFFAVVEWSALKVFIIDICKIYEEEKRNPLNSIPGILSVIELDRIQVRDFDPIKIFAKQHGVDIKEDEYLPTLRQLVIDFQEKYASNLESLKRFRDKKLAHSEAEYKVETAELPSFDIMERLLNFGIDFYSMIHEAYVGGSPVRHKIDKRIYTSLYFLLEKIGHTKIKKDFDS